VTLIIGGCRRFTHIYSPFAFCFLLLSDFDHHIYPLIIMGRECASSTVISRERNRIHARKTRQRKKEQMNTLQNRADELKEEQIRLSQIINEKNTASILVGLFSKATGNEKRVEADPRVEELLQRPVEQIPDASNLPELPALILPGQHNSKRVKPCDFAAIDKSEFPDDGIDYSLLGKDRSKCTPEELDQIRRERNRMHAKRTRDRKRLFLEEMADMCKRIEDENLLLQYHLNSLDGVTPATQSQPSSKPAPISPELSAASPSEYVPPMESTASPSTAPSDKPGSSKTCKIISQNGVTFDQIETLLEAAGTFSSTSTASAVSASSNNSESESMSDQDDNSACKRRRLNGSSASSVPELITTTATTAVGC
jgi:hypothetical protein